MSNELKQINFLDENGKAKKLTKYIRSFKDWTQLKEITLFTEVGKEFSDPELHIGDEWRISGVQDFEEENIRVVNYDYKYVWSKRMKIKLENGTRLERDEIQDLVLRLKEIHRETGENGRLRRPIISVVELDGNLYAIEWLEGLTSEVFDEFWTQPYPVKMDVEKIEITKTTLTKI